MNQQKYLRLLIIEIELHGNVNESNGIHLKKFSCFNFEIIKTNRYKLKCLTRLSFLSWGAIETHCYQVYGVQQRKMTKIGKKMHLNFAR